MRNAPLTLAAVVFVLGGIAFYTWPQKQNVSVDYKIPGNPLPKIQAAAAAAIQRREKQIDQTIWAKEILAQQYGRVFEDYWDAINAATNKLLAASKLQFDSLSLGSFDLTEHLSHQIDIFRPSKPGRTISGTEWPAFIKNFSKAGWRLAQLEFRHNAFDPETKSRFFFAAHFTNTTPASAAIEGDLTVEWKSGSREIARIDATQLQIKFRPGPPAFVPILDEAFDKPDLTDSIEPLNVVDLDNDGIPEIILPALNRIYRGAKFDPLYTGPRLQIFNGLFAEIGRAHV